MFSKEKGNSNPGVSACELGHIDFEASKSIVQLITHLPTYIHATEKYTWVWRTTKGTNPSYSFSPKDILKTSLMYLCIHIFCVTNRKYMKVGWLETSTWLGIRGVYIYVREEPAFSCRLTGWVRVITGWSSRLQEIY